MRKWGVPSREPKGKLEHVHTLNGSVVIPEALRKYMNGLEVIKP